MDLKNRLNNVIHKDKQTNPKYILEVIKSDLFYLLNNYFEVDFNDINIDVKVEEEKYVLNIKAKGDRIKMFGGLPE